MDNDHLHWMMKVLTNTIHQRKWHRGATPQLRKDTHINQLVASQVTGSNELEPSGIIKCDRVGI